MSGAIGYVTEVLADSGIEVARVDERSFPEERWLIVYVPEASMLAAQSTAGVIERALNTSPEHAEIDAGSWVVTFRPAPVEAPQRALLPKGRLFTREVDQLVQLLEARSRTSDALPSLNYVEDPRASLAAVGASRHHLIYGRRGVGKTALLLEAKRNAERQGHVTVWFNAHVVRNLPPSEAFLAIAENALSALSKHAGSSSGSSFAKLGSLNEELKGLRASGRPTEIDVARYLPDLNNALRGLLREGLLRMYIYVDDFYLFPSAGQSVVLDHLAAMLRDCDGWLKIASIERLTRPFEPSSKVGLEVPHDASIIDIDVTLEDPGAAQRFLESVLSNYTRTAGIRQPSAIAKPQALGRLVLASGGVPRDYLNLFAASIVVARTARELAREVGKEDVAVAAGSAARGKKRDLEQDVTSDNAEALLSLLGMVSAFVKGKEYTYFLIDMSQKSTHTYELLGQLVDLRFAHMVQGSLSDQHRPGTRYEAYVLDLSEFTDVRLQRGLNVLDLESGKWTWRLTGKGRTMQTLTGTQLRDRLRQAPVVDLESLAVAPGQGKLDIK